MSDCLPGLFDFVSTIVCTIYLGQTPLPDKKESPLLIENDEELRQIERQYIKENLGKGVFKR